MSLWAAPYIKDLQVGKTVSFHPSGNSMTPIIRSHDLCVVTPIGDTKIQRGDVVLCKVKGNHYLHKVLTVGEHKYLIGNNHGGRNGWIRRENIYGILASVSK